MEKFTMIELFSGIGAQVRGFKNSGLFDAEVIATSEIDKDAMLSYAAIHCGLTPELMETYDYPSADEMIEYLESRNIGYVFEKDKPFDWQKKRNSVELKKYYLACVLSKNLGDIVKVAQLPYADFVSYSSPCTDLSVAGKMAGLERGKTRSGLLYEVERLLTVAKQNNTLPKYLLLENVANLVGARFKPAFDEWCLWLSDLGYNTYWHIINSKDTGIPQNRERVFAISIRKDIDTKKFEFPQPFDTGIRLFHVIDLECEDKYIINSDAADKAINEMANNGILAEEEKLWQELIKTRDNFPNYGIICNSPKE
jgi:DNA (cytosine-5)-methyltransferase 1